MRALFKSAICALAALGFAQAHAADEIAREQPVSQAAIDVAGWVIASKDHRGLPFAIIDKASAQILVFGDDGKLRGMAPALLGSAIGDRSAPGVGDKPLSAIAADERTTPAGRFFAAYGPAPGGKKVLWIDYATAVSIHPLSETDHGEKRQERLSSPSPEDNRITHGCINVSAPFYDDVVRATFKKAGVFYVLPETDSMAEALPAYAPPRALKAAAKTRR